MMKQPSITMTIHAGDSQIEIAVYDDFKARMQSNIPQQDWEAALLDIQEIFTPVLIDLIKQGQCTTGSTMTH